MPPVDVFSVFARTGGHFYSSLCTFWVNIYLLKKERRLPLGNRLRNKKEKKQIGKNARLIETEWDNIDP